MSTDSVLLLLTLAVGGLFSTLAGGGLGIIMLIAGSFFFDIRTNIAFVSLLMLGIQLSKTVTFWSSIRWPIVWQYSVLGLPTSLAGGLLLFAVDPKVPTLLLAVLCGSYVIIRLLKPHYRLPQSVPLTVTAGAVNGFIGGLVGNSALLRLPIFLSFGLTKEVLIGTSSAAALLMNIGKVIAYVPQLQWSQDQILTLLLSVPILLISVALGKKQVQRMSQQWFERLALVVIAAGAIRLFFVL